MTEGMPEDYYYCWNCKIEFWGGVEGEIPQEYELGGEG
jgi:hypothetical protein